MVSTNPILQAERHIRTLMLAKQCAALGARMRTIEFLTGLTPLQIDRLFRHHLGDSKQGRHPDSREWYHNANLLSRAEASMLASTYRCLAAHGIDPPHALITAYKRYRNVCSSHHHISLDRAFDLVAHAEGRWFTIKRSFSLFTCPTCRNEFLTGLSFEPQTNRECPICKLLHRHPRDHRIQAAFPVLAIPAGAAIPWMPAYGIYRFDAPSDHGSSSKSD